MQLRAVSQTLPTSLKEVTATTTNTIAAIVGVVLIDIIGMLFWKVNAGLSWKVAFLSGFVAFIPLDLVKAVIAAQIIPAFRKVMQSAE